MDPFYVAQAKAFPMSELELNFLEEDDIQTRNLRIIKRIKNSLVDKRKVNLGQAELDLKKISTNF